MNVGQLLQALASWAGLSSAATLNALGVVVGLLSAIGTLLAVGVSLLTAAAARRDAQKANARLKTYQQDRDREDLYRRLDERARVAAFGPAGAAFVRVRTEWNDTPGSGFWTFKWRVSGRTEITVLSAATDPPFVTNPSDHRPVDLFAQTENSTPLFLPSTGATGDGSVVFGSTAQCFVLGPHDLSRPPRLVITFRDRERNEWQLDSDMALILLNPRVIQAQREQADAVHEDVNPRPRAPAPDHS